MKLEFDTKELDDISNNLIKMAIEDYPKRTNKFLKHEAGEFNKIAKKKARSKLKNLRPARDKKSYMAGFKKGKPYHYLDDRKDKSIRAYNNRPHAHLIEDGHVVKVGNKNGDKQKKSPVRGPKKGQAFVRGFHIIADTQKEYDRIFEENCSKLIDEMLEEGFH